MTWVNKGTRHNTRSEDLTGQRFGKLTVLARDGVKSTGAMFMCRCDCGKERSIPGRNLRKGVISCGCERGPKGKAA